MNSQEILEYQTSFVEASPATQILDDYSTGEKQSKELLKLSHSVDEWSALMKKAVIGECMNIIKYHENKSGEEVKRLSETVGQLQNELSVRSSAYDETKSTLERKEKLLDHLILRHIWGPKKLFVKRFFNKWYAKTASIASVASSKYIFSNHVARMHRKRTLQKKTIQAWVVDVMQKKWKRTLGKQAKAEADAEIQKMEAEHREVVEKLENKIQELEMRLNSTMLDKQKYAKHLKDALLRGVCALNLETMTAFGGEEGEVKEEDLDTLKRLQMFSPAKTRVAKVPPETQEVVEEQWPSVATVQKQSLKNVFVAQPKINKERGKIIHAVVDQTVSGPVSWVTIREGDIQPQRETLKMKKNHR